ncbi:MAG: C69 family dipeptidase [Clostridia bacterium]|nr:C69 family dipeptidase [Clostridia bacterium]
MKKLLSIILVCILVCMLSAGASACTGVYIGKKVSTDGDIMIARSNDTQGVYPTRVVVVPRVELYPNREMPVDGQASVVSEIPDTTFKYSGTPLMESAILEFGSGMDDAVCVNEYGVAMTMSVTAFSNKAAMTADPWVSDGITETTMDQLVITVSKTAKEAVQNLALLMDQFGSSETNIALIIDRNEAWYVEMYTGHQYAAVKLPDDKVAAFGNEFSLEYLSDYEESIVSADLEKLAVDNGFAVYGENGELNLLLTYAGPETVQNYSHMRTWIGHKLLAPGDYGDYNKEDRYPLAFTPKNKVSLQAVMEIMRNRYEGTEYSPDETGRKDMRVIGTDTSMSVHIVDINPNLPPSIAGTTWICLAPAPYGVFVPLNILCSEPSESYAANQPEGSLYQFESDRYPYYTFKELNTLCLTDYKTYGVPVRNYWHNAEKRMIEGMKAETEAVSELLKTDPARAQRRMTDYCSALQEKAFEDAKALLNQVRWTMSANSNTMKMGMNPETDELYTTERVLEPIRVELDVSFYGK